MTIRGDKGMWRAMRARETENAIGEGGGLRVRFRSSRSLFKFKPINAKMLVRIECLEYTIVDHLRLIVQLFQE